MGRLRGRAAAAAADQAFYSLQNFAVAFTALHVLELGDLGAFTLTSTLLILTQVAVRALTGEPLTIRFSARRDEVPTAVASATGAALALTGLLLTICAALWAAGLGGTALASAAGLVLVTLAIQDTYRFALFAAGRMWSATLNDGLVCGVTLLALWLLGVTHTLDGPLLFLAWAAGSGAGVLLGAWQVGALPRPDRTADWFRAHRDVGLPLMGSVVAQQSMGRLSLVIVSAVAGPAQLGLVTASRTVLSPVNTLVASTYSFAVPEAVRRRSDARALLRFTSGLSVALALVAVVLTGALLAAPDAWGRVLAGQNWDGARRLLVPTCLWIVGVALSQGSRVGLRALERTDLVLRVSLVLGSVLLVATTIGTFLGEGTGAAWGFGIASIVGQVGWTWAYRRALRSPGVGPGVGDATQPGE